MEANLLVLEVQDLRKGDVVLVANQAEIFEARLRQHPKFLVPRSNYRKATHTWKGIRRYSTIPCDVREEKFTYTSGYNGNPFTVIRPVIAGDKDYNVVKRIDFTERKVIVIKRDEP